MGNLKTILKDERVYGHDIEVNHDGLDTHFFFIKDEYYSNWERGNTITDESPFTYTLDMLKAKDGIVKK
jgi:hypothetical protein